MHSQIYVYNLHINYMYDRYILYKTKKMHPQSNYYLIIQIKKSFIIGNYSFL